MFDEPGQKETTKRKIREGIRDWEGFYSRAEVYALQYREWEEQRARVDVPLEHCTRFLLNEVTVMGTDPPGRNGILLR